MNILKRASEALGNKKPESPNSDSDHLGDTLSAIIEEFDSAETKTERARALRAFVEVVKNSD